MSNSYDNGGNNDSNTRLWHITTDTESINVIDHRSYYVKCEDKKFACVICSKTFGRLWNLERHIKTIHNEHFSVYT